MAKEKSNIIKKSKPTMIMGLKALSGWLFTNKRREDIQLIIDKYEIENNVMKRLTSYVYNTPYLVWYINKYLNKLYDFNKYDTADLIRSFSYLLDINRLNATNKVFYLKSNDLADKNRQKVKEFFKDYFDKLYEKHFNDLELNFFYDLLNIGVINVEDIDSMSKHLDGDKSSINLEDFNISTIITSANTHTTNKNAMVMNIYRDLSIPLKTFCDGVKKYMSGCDNCKGCELKGKQIVLLDTNLKEFGPVDIIFIGYNPNMEDIESNKPFAGKNGMILREKIAQLPETVTWLIINLVFCVTAKEGDIKDPTKAANNCSPIFSGILKNFPTKCKVPLGAKATKILGINDGISSISGKIFTQEDINVIPMIHPNSLIHDQKNVDKFNKDFQTILNLFSSNSTTVIAPTIIKTPEIAKGNKKSYTSSITIPEDKLIIEVTPDLTFFDVKEINQQIVKIFIDMDGKKKYKIEPYEMNFYVKFDSWNECTQITNKIDAEVTITGREKPNLINKVRAKLDDIKNL
jgi:uracil-DNA glycosylase family 4